MDNRNFDNVINDPIEPQERVQKENQVVKKENVKTAIAGAISEKNLGDIIISKFDEMVKNNNMVIPQNYNVANEIKSAYYDLYQKGYLTSCTKASIGNALIELAVQGLSVANHQAYLIAYGGNVSLQRSYFGDIALLKRAGIIKDSIANVVREGDEFEVDYDNNNRLVVKSHHTNFANFDNAIIGAYAKFITWDNREVYEVMTRKQIQANFDQSKDRTRNFQTKFESEACKRTCIRRLAKWLVNTISTMSDEQREILSQYNRGVEEDYKTENDKERAFDNTTEVNEKVQATEQEVIDAEFDDDLNIQENIEENSNED
jgi:recombination protein RecT